MEFLLLGIALGFATLIPPGPVSLTLVQLGSRLGHQSALRGAAGVAAGDGFLAIVALLIIAAGSSLPTLTFTIMQTVAAFILVGLGAMLVARPAIAESSIGRIRRPGRALFALTSLTPSALGAWIALLAAMPFADQSRQLAVFAGGVVIASMLWHPALALLASSVGSRLSETGQLRLSQAGGVIMAGVGIALGWASLL